MNNNAKGLYDKASMLKDIDDRKQMIQKYQITGRLDRDKAIKMIQELRLTDDDIAAETSIRLAISSTPFAQASDQGIIAELQMQTNILSAKLLKSQ